MCFTELRLMIIRVGLIATGSFDGPQINTFEYFNVEGHEFVHMQKGNQRSYYFYVKVPSFDPAPFFEKVEQNSFATNLNKLFPQVVEFYNQQRMSKLQEFLDGMNLSELSSKKKKDIGSVLAEIERLSDLKEKGLLTEQEFGLLKAKLLEQN